MPRLSAVASPACIAVLALVATPLAIGSAQAAEPFPRLPKVVWELYLPEEHEACGPLYPLYAALPAADLQRLHSGEKVYFSDEDLDDEAAVKLATWFNSARWGCDPPAEYLDEDKIRRSTLLWKCEDNVVEFCLESPQKKIWKKLTVACAPERAEWVRDGLPLFPHWTMTTWAGGPRPPAPQLSQDRIRQHEMRAAAQGYSATRTARNEVMFLRSYWLPRRSIYRVYAELTPDQLRQLHLQGRLLLAFDDLTPAHREAVTAAVDVKRLYTNRAWQQPLDYRRTPEARARHFDITTAVFDYAGSDPQSPGLTGNALGMKLPGVDPCPPPARIVFMSIDASYPPIPGKPPTWHTFLVAMPPELQNSLLEWRTAYDSWWVSAHTVVGSRFVTKPWAGRQPTHPADAGPPPPPPIRWAVEGGMGGGTPP